MYTILSYSVRHQSIHLLMHENNNIKYTFAALSDFFFIANIYCKNESDSMTLDTISGGCIVYFKLRRKKLNLEYSY